MQEVTDSARRLRNLPARFGVACWRRFEFLARVTMQSRIVGTTMPVLEVLLQPGEALISEAGELSWMTQAIAMTTHTQMAGGGGIFGALSAWPAAARCL